MPDGKDAITAPTQNLVIDGNTNSLALTCPNQRCAIKSASHTGEPDTQANLAIVLAKPWRLKFGFMAAKTRDSPTR